MKIRNLLSVLLCGLIFCNSAPINVRGETNNEAVQKCIYVSNNGVDTNLGTQNAPFQTIQRAQQEVRLLTAFKLTGNIEVIIEGGVYPLLEPLRFSSEDSGNNGYSVIYKGNEAKYPLISGGRKIEGFQPVGNGVWKTKVDGLNIMRELYVNNSRVYRASTEKEVVGIGNYDDPNTAYPYDGIYFDKRVLGTFENANEIDFRWGIGWKGNSTLVERIIPDPTNPNRNIAIMKQPYYNFVATVPQWGHPARYDFGFRIENAFELLNSPGEYYFNSKTKDLFYIPREGEDMTSAEVYAPVLEKLLIIDGGDGKLVENLHFEGLKFAHATYLLPAMTGYYHGQSGDNFVGRSREELNTSASIDIKNSKNVSIKNSVIFGTGGAAIKTIYNVTNCDIVGNAIYDTGETGISVGLPNQEFIQQTEPPGYREDMVPRSISEVSDSGNFGQFVRSIYSGEGGSWYPMNDVKAGRKSYLSLQFDLPVCVDEIRLITKSYVGNVKEKSNFIVQLSNDADFVTATTIYTQGSVGFTPEVLTIKPNNSQKYKYFKISKTVVEPFEIDELCIYTKDIKWYKKDVCRNINISNNYLTRIANYYYGGAGICMYYCDSLTVQHNEIYNTPYSAMGLGWGWHNGPNSTLSTKVYNNLVDSYNNECHDGAAIYTIGRHTNGEIKGNYLKNANGPYGCIYFDEGSSDFTVDNNVVENSPNPIFIWTPKNTDNTVTNTYANSPKFVNVGTNTKVEEMKTFISGNPTPEAKEIIDNAGITAQYMAIKNLVPDSKAYFGNDRMDNFSSVYFHFADKFYDEWTHNMEYIAKNMLLNDRYGTLPGQYSPQAKLLLEERQLETRSRMRAADTTGKGMAERYIRFEKAMREYENSFIRLSITDTIAVARKLIVDTSVGTEIGQTTVEAKNKFQLVIDKSNEISQDDYTSLRNLESAINDFDKSVKKADILAMKLEGIDALPIINRENRTIDFFVNENVNIKALKSKVVVTNNCKIFPNFKDEVDFTYNVQAIVKNACKNVVWTIRVNRLTGNKTDLGNWWNWNDDKITVNGDIMKFAQSYKPYMYLGEKTNNIKMDIKSDKYDNVYGTRIVFDSVNGELVSDGIEQKNSYFELVLTNSVVSLYRIERGQRKIIYGSVYDGNKLMEDIIKTSDYMDLNNSNTVEISTFLDGNKKRVVVKINDKTAINTLCNVDNMNEKWHYGLYAPDSDVILR